MNQRWMFGRDSYRPPDEVIRPSEYDVGRLADDKTPKAFVEAHHYSRSYPAARFRYGFYRLGRLVGVAVFSHPCRNEVLTSVFPGELLESVELGRLVLLDEVPGNGESFFIARCFEALRREDIRGVLAFSDPVPRWTWGEKGGRLVKPGHVGTVYQATNGRFLGRGTVRTLRLLPDGRVFSDRAASKIRAGVKGWEYSSRFLQEFGADEPWEDRKAWLSHWRPLLTRSLRHQGNFKYAWGLDRRMQRALPAAAGPYPKLG